MNGPDAMKEVWTLVQGSHPFSGSNVLYGGITWALSYPLGSLDVPTVALSPAGGLGQRRGKGTWSRITMARYQLDILTNTLLEAQRIHQHVRLAVLEDYQNDAGSGALGLGYLRGKQIRQVVIGEPSVAPWDEQGRVQRLVSFVDVEYLEGA